MGLRKRVSDLMVSVLPDFYFDRIVRAPSFRNLIRQVELKAASSGGNLRGLFQTEVKGKRGKPSLRLIIAVSKNKPLRCGKFAYTGRTFKTS